MRIGELAGLAGVSTKTVRYYEQLGLLPTPDRRPSGYRDYAPDVTGSASWPVCGANSTAWPGEHGRSTPRTAPPTRCAT